MDCKQKAQLRNDQIDAFNAEMENLTEEGIFTLDDESKSNIQAYHQSLIKSLSESFDIDTTKADKQLNIGMRIASLFGALALAASLFFLFYQYWGFFGTTAQTAVLVLSPLFLLGLTAVFYNKEPSGYFAKIAALITLASFVLNISMLGQIYNITPSPNAFVIWSVLALVFAYKLNSRLLLVFAILLFAAFLSARVGTLFGIYWFSFGNKPENFFAPALVIFALGHFTQKHYGSFSPIYRIFGSILLLMPVLLLSHWAGGSYFELSTTMIEHGYQTLGFVLSAGLIGYGVRKHWSDIVNTGTVFFTLFLYTKFFDWWWDWFPKYLFFLVIALSSILLLMIFKRLRNKMKGAERGATHAE